MSKEMGTAGNDNLNGGSGDDYLYGGDGSDKLSGGAGSDILDGGSGSDSLNGGSGNDTLIYNLTQNSAAGTKDVYTGGSGVDTLVVQFTQGQWDLYRAQINTFVEKLKTITNPNNGEVSNGSASDFVFNFGNSTLTVQMTERVQVYVQDGAGYVLVLDSADRSATALDAPDLAAASDTGGSSVDNNTRDTTPTLTGSGAEPLATVKLYDGSTLVGTTIADLHGNWSIDSDALSDGSHQLRVVQVDVMGNISAPSAALTVVIDTTAPVAGTLGFAGLTDTGSMDTPTAVTQDNSFTLALNGTTDANATTTVYQVSTDGGAHWTTTTAAQNALADGSYQYRAIVTDTAGNSSTSNAISVVIDRTGPTAGALSFTGLTDTGSADSPAAVTTDNSFSLSLTGTNDANATTTAYEISTDGGAHWASTTASQNGLGDGSYQFRAVVTDAAGNSSPSNAVQVVIDTTGPVAGTLSFDGLDDTGSADAPAAITKDGSFNLALVGTSDASATTTAYQVSLDDGPWTSTTAGQSNLADGSYQYRAVVTDAAGNSSASNTISVVVDNTAPVAGTLSFADLTDTGSLQSPAITQDGSFDLSLAGTSDAHATTTAYEVSVNGGAWTATSASQSDLADGSYQYRAVVTDAAGNSSESNVISVVVDNTDPTAGTLSFVGLDDTGSADTPVAITQDNDFNLSLTGSNDANATTIVYERSSDGGATWTGTDATQSGLADGTYRYHAVVTDAAGNSSTTDAIDVVIDNTDPDAGTLSFAALDDTGSVDAPAITQNNDFNLSLAGSSDANATSTAYEVSVDGGAWTTTTAFQSSLADGSYSFRAVVTDAAGNSSQTDSIDVVIDNTAPVAGTLSFTDLTDTGSLQSPAITQDGTFSLSLAGSSDAHATTVVYERSNDDGATWSVTDQAQSGLADGNYRYHAVVTDAAGNSSTTDAIEVVIDNTAPNAGTLSFADLDDTGSAQAPAVTQDNDFRLNLTGITDANTTDHVIERSDDGGTSWHEVAAVESNVADGSYQYRAVVTDAAGNSSQSNTLSVVIDRTAPVAGALSFNGLTDTGSLQSPAITQDGTFNLNLAGTSDANATTTAYQVSLDGGAWTSTTAAQSSLADGSYQFRAQVTDAAGNSSVSNVISVVIDNTAPTAGTLSFAGLDDTGSLQTPAITQDNSFSLSQSASNDANATTMAYEVSVNGGAWTGTTAAQAGLADGSYQYRAVVTDAAGNTANSNTIGVVIDRTAPTAGALSFAGLVDTGNAQIPVITQDNSFSLNLAGTNDASATSVVYERSTDGGTTWSATPQTQTGLADGAYRYHAVVTDAAGNSSVSNAVSVVIDNTAPTAGTLGFTGLTDTGSTQTPAITQDNDFSLNLVGAADANGITTAYEVSLNGGAWTGTTLAQSGLADGSYQYRAVVTDAAGNSSTSNAVSVVIDRTAPTTPVITSVNDDAPPITGTIANNGSTNDKTPTLVGTAESNSSLVIRDGATVLGTATADGAGAWSFTSTALADGTHSFTATATDAAGNTSVASASYAVTVTTNQAPTDITLGSTGAAVGTSVPAGGVAIATLSTTDPDAGDSFTYTLGGTNASAFAVSGSTLLTGAAGLAQSTNYSFSITSTDQAGASYTESFRVITGSNAGGGDTTSGGNDDASNYNGEDILLAGNGGNGGGANDMLFGLGGNDLLYGQGGRDDLHGGTGNDVLTGNDGTDTFYFDTALNGTTNVDRVTDFNANNADVNAADKLLLSNSVFGLGASGTLAAADYGTINTGGSGNLTGQSVAAGVNIVYDGSTGALYYDADGGGLDNAVQFAVVTVTSGAFDRTDILLGS